MNSLSLVTLILLIMNIVLFSISLYYQRRITRNNAMYNHGVIHGLFYSLDKILSIKKDKQLFSVFYAFKEIEESISDEIIKRCRESK